MECRVVSRFREFEQGGSWVVEEPYDITSKVIGCLLDFTQPPGTVKGVVSDGGSNRWGSGQEAGTVGRYEPGRWRLPFLRAISRAASLTRRC